MIEARSSPLLRILAFAPVVLALPGGVAAQQTGDRQAPGWYSGHVSLLAGVSVFDRSAEGTTGIYAFRVDMPLWPNILLEGGLSYARPNQDPGVDDVFLPGLQVHLQGTAAHLRPYAGLGAGVAVERPSDGGSSDVYFSPSFSAGMRIVLSEGAGLRFEGRLNAVGADFLGYYSELVGGLSITW
ncbi:MAG TPA: hypothetical protein VLA09_13185 [Longimicrobiales bacterium]|nr:hypothetical protein [Longimicrobiales bacterium]